MASLYSPPTQCERSAYDSLWCRIVNASRDGNNTSETPTAGQIFSFFKSYGFRDDDLLSHVGGLSIPNEDSTSSDRFTKKRFYILMRALAITQYSTSRRVLLSDITDSRCTDIPLFRFDRLAYSPSSACERGAYETLWDCVNTTNSISLSGDKVVSFAMRSGLQKGTLSKCWNTALDQSGRHNITKEEFFVFLRCLSFVQVTGINNVNKEHILSTACRDFPLPNFYQNEKNEKNKNGNNDVQTTYPLAFYFPTTKLETSAYNDLWIRASTKNSEKSENSGNSVDRISAITAVSFLVTSRLRRTM